MNKNLLSQSSVDRESYTSWVFKTKGRPRFGVVKRIKLVDFGNDARTPGIRYNFHDLRVHKRSPIRRAEVELPHLGKSPASLKELVSPFAMKTRDLMSLYASEDHSMLGSRFHKRQANLLHPVSRRPSAGKWPSSHN